MKTELLFLLLISATFLPGCNEPARLDPSFEEINAVNKMSLELKKTNAYARIALRTDLSEAAQVHLVRAVFDNLAFDSSKSLVLLTLIDNPAFCPAAETAILKRLDRLSFENTQDNILKAINATKQLQTSKISNSDPNALKNKNY